MGSQQLPLEMQIIKYLIRLNSKTASFFHLTIYFSAPEVSPSIAKSRMRAALTNLSNMGLIDRLESEKYDTRASWMQKTSKRYRLTEDGILAAKQLNNF